MRRHPLLRLLPLFGPSRGLLVASIGGLTVASAANLAGPWLIGRAIDHDLMLADRAGLTRTALAYLAVLGIGLAATWVSRVGIEIAAQRAMLALKEQLFAHLVGHDLAFHDRHPSGRQITRVQGDTEALRLLFADVILTTPADVAMVLGMAVVLWATTPWLLIVVFATTPVYVALFLVFRWISPPMFLEVRRLKAQLTGFLAEHLRAMPVLQTFDREAWARGRADAMNRALFDAEFVADLQPVWYFNTVLLAQRVGIVATLLVGGGLIAAGTATVGELVLGLGYVRLMLTPLMRLSNQLSTLERARAAGIRVAEILDTPRTIADPPEPVPWPGLRDALRLEDVGFAYVDGTPVLDGLSLELPAGANTGIVGATGAGKSTVLNLLLRFRDPTRGRVTVDGTDLRALTIGALRGRIGLVQQDVHLFPGTVLDNLGGDPEAARRALDRVGVDLPLDRVLLDRGADLSRGERQLLTFARALVGDPEILVLDEATSAIDPETERAVQGALQRATAGRTTVTVAHRLATVRGCDRIYVLARGRVCEVGTHDELLARGGTYAALARLQGLAA